MHIPVLVEEVLSLIRDQEIKTVFDGTCGAGGHAFHILESHPECETYIASDQDPKALLLAKEKLSPFSSKVQFRRGVYQDPPKQLFDLILIDIGVSSMQLDDESRGFSFMHEGPLDMRMDPDAPISAFDIVNNWDKTSLENLFYEFGEERLSRRAAFAICEARKKKDIQTTKDLSEILSEVLPRHGKAHPATKVFQALRIEVNHELDVLTKGLPILAHQLNTGGQLLVITFHSLEDRIVKQTFRDLAKNEPFAIITKKPIAPSYQEVVHNRRSRSAHLRALKKV